MYSYEGNFFVLTDNSRIWGGGGGGGGMNIHGLCSIVDATPTMLCRTYSQIGLSICENLKYKTQKNPYMVP